MTARELFDRLKRLHPALPDRALELCEQAIDEAIAVGRGIGYAEAIDALRPDPVKGAGGTEDR